MKIPDPTQIGCGGWIPPKADSERVALGPSDATACSASSLSGEQIEILKHTVKNGRYCGGGKDTEALTAAGLMHYLGTPAWCPDPFYTITEAGKAAIRGQNAY